MIVLLNIDTVFVQENIQFVISTDSVASRTVNKHSTNNLCSYASVTMCGGCLLSNTSSINRPKFNVGWSTAN